jgi:hypothetical protein
MAMRSGCILSVASLAPLLGLTGSAASLAAAGPYPAMADLSRYLEPTPAAEVALARSAAPASISGAADVLVLGKDGYAPAEKGGNGFVCLVERAWAMGFADAEFWNPAFRAPTCYNAAAARSVLPRYLERTRWVLSGVPKADMLARTRAQIAAHTFRLPDSGSMAYMMSKQMQLHDADHHWHPHVMFYQSNTAPAAWGANLKGSPVLADDSSVFATDGEAEPLTIFFVPVAHWSDGSAEVPGGH